MNPADVPVSRLVKVQLMATGRLGWVFFSRCLIFGVHAVLGDGGPVRFRQTRNYTL